MKMKIALVAASLVLHTPAMARDNGIDRLIQRFTGAPIEAQPLFRTGHFVVRGPVQATGIISAVTASALSHGVPVSLAHGVVRVESGYNCGAPHGGLMQVLPRTAAGVGIRGNLRSCGASLEAGMRYLRQAWIQSRGNMCVAATLYNAGSAARRQCSTYGRRVLSRTYG